MTRGPRDVRRRELGGRDPLDRRLGSPPPSPFAWLLSLLRTRSALGLAPSLTPAALFLLLGAVAGPHALGFLSAPLLARLDLAVTIALAILGIIVGILALVAVYAGHSLAVGNPQLASLSSLILPGG